MVKKHFFNQTAKHSSLTRMTWSGPAVRHIWTCGPKPPRAPGTQNTSSMASERRRGRTEQTEGWLQLYWVTCRWTFLMLFTLSARLWNLTASVATSWGENTTFSFNIFSNVVLDYKTTWSIRLSMKKMVWIMMSTSHWSSKVDVRM